MFGERRNHGSQLGIRDVEQRNSLGVPPIGDNQLARIHMDGVQPVMIEEIGNDEAGEPFAETRDGVNGARGEFA